MSWEWKEWRKNLALEKGDFCNKAGRNSGQGTTSKARQARRAHLQPQPPPEKVKEQWEEPESWQQNTCKSEGYTWEGDTWPSEAWTGNTWQSDTWEDWEDDTWQSDTWTDDTMTLGKMTPGQMKLGKVTPGSTQAGSQKGAEAGPQAKAAKGVGAKGGKGQAAEALEALQEEAPCLWTGTTPAQSPGQPALPEKNGLAQEGKARLAPE